LNFSTF